MDGSLQQIDMDYLLVKWANFLLVSATNPFGKNWAYDIYSGGNDVTQNMPKYREYFKLTNPTAGTGYAFTANVLFTIDELLLNRAEAYAMKEGLCASLKRPDIVFSKKSTKF